jgi:hypothetical protein
MTQLNTDNAVGISFGILFLLLFLIAIPIVHSRMVVFLSGL